MIDAISSRSARALSSGVRLQGNVGEIEGDGVGSIVDGAGLGAGDTIDGDGVGSVVDGAELGAGDTGLETGEGRGVTGAGDGCYQEMLDNMIGQNEHLQVRLYNMQTYLCRRLPGWFPRGSRRWTSRKWNGSNLKHPRPKLHIFSNIHVRFVNECGFPLRSARVFLYSSNSVGVLHTAKPHKQGYGTKPHVNAAVVY